jgi:hypothetical protein
MFTADWRSFAQVLVCRTRSTPNPAGAAARSRDWRIDVWRGLALLMIYVNHIPDNVFSILTTKYWGFADAAELFVFASGLSIAHALATRYAANVKGGMFFLGRRIVALYVCHLALVLVMAAIYATYAGSAPPEAPRRDMGLGPFFSETEKAVPRILTLTYLPQFMDILPMYIVLLSAAALAFPVYRARWWLYLVTALPLWMLARSFRFNLPDFSPSGAWFFNPFCWQLMFFTGFAIRFLRDLPWFDRLITHRAALPASGAIVLAGLFGAAPWAYRGLLTEWTPLEDILTPYLDKQYLSPLRYIHFLGCAHLAYIVTRRYPGMRFTVWARVCAVIGQFPLPVFAFSTILAVCGTILVDLHGGGAAAQAAVTGIGVCAMALFAIALKEMRAAARTPENALIPA